MFEIVEQENLKARIKVIGIGGGGGKCRQYHDREQIYRG